MSNNYFKKVSVFIVGAPKCATTTIHGFLDSCEGIFMSHPKELNYFSAASIRQQSLYYDEDIIDSEKSYNEIFKSASESQILGESSVSYFYYDSVPAKIYEYNPASKIVIVLRNPIERAYSHYLMDSRLGYCSKKLVEIVRNPNNNPLHYQQYIKISQYTKQVTRYLKTFGSDNVHLIIQERFRNNPEKELQKLCQFLNISFPESSYNLISKNVFKLPRNSVVAGIYKNIYVRRIMRSFLPDALNGQLKKLFFRVGPKPVLDKNLHSILSSLFKKDIATVESIIGHKIEEWE